MRLRIVFFILALGTIAAAGIGGYFYFQAEQASVISHIEGDLAARTADLKEQIVNLISEYEREVRVLVRFEELKGALKNRNPEALAQATRILSHVSARRLGDVCYLMDGKGNTVASSNYKEPDSFVGNNYSFRPYFSIAMEGRNSIYMGVGVTSNQRGVYFGYPVIVEGSDIPLGVAVIKASIEHIEEIISRKRDGIVLFVHDSGLIFLASRSEWILNTLWRLYDQESDRITATKQFGKGPWKWTGFEQKSLNRAVDRSGAAYLLHETGLEAYPDWRVVALTSFASLSQRTSPPWMARSMYGILGVLGMVTGGMVILFMLAHRDIQKRQQAECELLASKDDLSQTVKILQETLAQQKQTEESLRDSEERYRAFFNTSRDSVFMITADGRFIDLNDVTVEMLGYALNQREEILSKKTVDFYAHPEKREANIAMISKTGFTKEYPVDLRKRDGTVLHTLITAVARKDRHGNVVGFQGTIRDITERKQAEEALKESEQRYRTLFEESIDGVYSVLRDGEIADANASFCRLFGYAKEEMIGKDIRELYVNPADHSRFQEEIEKSEFVKDYEVKFRTRAGIAVDCLLTSSVHYGKDGSIAGYRGILRDLTIYKRLQKQLLQAQKMEAVGTLAGGVSHDFNNILQVVIGFSELVLADESLPDRYRDDLEKVLQAGKNGAELIQRLLMFSRKTEPKPLDLDLNQRIRQIQKFLQRTIPKMIDIELILADDLARIHADPTQLDQVLMNLAVNARDAMSERGKLVIETENAFIDEDYARTHLDAEPGWYVLLHISDTGCGMGKETVEHIFEPFFTTKEIGRGTGLGLAMVHGIVKQHNGHITVKSEVGKGTTFNVFLPAVQDPTETVLESTGIMPAFGMETVLLVDDEEFIRKLGVRILTKHGYTVLQAKNGREALDLFKKERTNIGVVILDLIMPEMSGIECLRGLLKIDPKVKILVASGYAADTSVKETIQQGAKGFFTKPFRVNEILREVRRILDEN